MNKFSLIFAFLVLAFSANFEAPSLYLGHPEYKVISQLSSGSFLNEKEEMVFDFSKINLEAKSALVMRMNDGKIIFEKNKDEARAFASLAKLMTALVAERMKTKQKDFEILIPITKEALSQEGDEGLLLNEIFSSAVLRDIMLLGSSNDAAYALAEGFGAPADDFIWKMNEEAESIGLSNSLFLNPTGLDILNARPGAKGTAADLAKLAFAILKNYPYIFDITGKEEAEFLSENGFSHKIKNTNKLVAEIPGLLGGKTGFSDLAGGNLLLVADLSFNEPYLFIVLGSSYEGRFGDAEKLYQALKNSL